MFAFCVIDVSAIGEKPGMKPANCFEDVSFAKCIFNEQGFPAGLTLNKPDSRKEFIEKRRAFNVTHMHVDVGVG